jgi:hypothetical protein
VASRIAWALQVGCLVSFLSPDCIRFESAFTAGRALLPRVSYAASMSAEDEGEEGAYTTCWVTAQRKKDGAMLVRLPRYTDASKILEASTTLV